MKRHEALVQIRRRFIAKGYPRLVGLVFVTLSGLAAFGFSTALFRLGVDHLGLRYLAATVAGYGVFLLLMRIWIELNRPNRDQRSATSCDD
jgi:hypothetical protein